MQHGSDRRLLLRKNACKCLDLPLGKEVVLEKWVGEVATVAVEAVVGWHHHSLMHGKSMFEEEDNISLADETAHKECRGSSGVFRVQLQLE